MLKYLKKENINISVPTLESFKYNDRYWKISKNKSGWHYGTTLGRVQINNKLYDLWPETIEKEFFVFVFIGNKFPIINKKEKLLILHKYKFSKVYVSINNELYCYYFKRGVLFDKEWIDKYDKNLLRINRLFKLIKLKTKSENDID